MASTYVNDLRLNEMATGDASGTWGTTTNTNLELIAEAFSYGTEAITTNADTHTTTIADGATDPGRSMFLKYTGTLDSTCTITIGPNTVSKLWIIENGTSGSQSIIIKQGTGGTVTIPSGKTKVIYADGAGSGGAMVDAFASLNLETSGIIETSSSIQTPLIEYTDGDDAMTIADGGGVTFAQTATFSDDIIIGDGKTIGSASDVDAMTIAANGQITLTQTLIGTALDISGDIDIDGTTNLDVVDIDGAVDMASTLQVDGAITSSSGATITTADNTNQLTLVSTDADAAVGPVLDLYRNSGSPADDDFLGKINFRGRNDNSQDVNYGYLSYFIADASDGTEDGFMQLGLIKGGSNTLLMEAGATETVFNQSSVDQDFRVESDGNANMLFVDGGKNSVGIGTTPEAHYTGYVGLDIGVVGSLFASGSGVNVTTLTNNGFLNSDASQWTYKVTDEATMYSQVHGDHRFSTAASGSADAAITWSEKIRFQAAGGISFNGDTAAANALDDYEEGTFTPTFSTSNSTATGLYQKVGNTVTVFVHVVSTGGLPSSGGQVQIGNLPFTSASNHISAGPIYIGPSNVSSATGGGGQISTIMTNSETVIRLVNVDTGTLGYTLWGELEVSHNNVVTAFATHTYTV